jgi:hypothetical protein
VSAPRAAAAVVVVCVALAIPLLAAARRGALRDGNDTKGPLDIRRVRLIGETKPVWKTFMGRRWTARRLRDRGFVLVFLDTFAGERADYYVLARSTGSRLQATLYRDRAARGDRRVMRLDLWRRDRRSVSVRVPLRRLRVGAQRDRFDWYVQTLMSSGRCRRVCFDRAPNRGAVEEPLGGAPTPSPSPSE